MSNFWGAFSKSPSLSKPAMADEVIRNANSLIYLQTSAAIKSHYSSTGSVIVIGHLNGPHQQAKEPLAALFDLYRRRGPDFLQDCSGQFAIIILFSGSDHAFFASDRLNLFPIYLKTLEDGIAFSSLSFEKTLPEPALLLEQFYFNTPDPISSPDKLPGATYAIWRDGHLSTYSYWEPSSSGTAPVGHFTQRKALFERHLARSVGRYGNFEKTAVHVQGDLPSWLIAQQLAATPSQKRTDVFYVDFEGLPSVARSLADFDFRQNCRFHRTYVTPKAAVEQLDYWLSKSPAPIGHLSAVSTYFAANAAKQSGFDNLLSAEGTRLLYQHSSRYSETSLWKSLIRTFIPTTPERILSETLDQHWLTMTGIQNVFSDEFLAESMPDRIPKLLTQYFEKNNSLTEYGRLQSLSLIFRLSSSQLSYLRFSAQFEDITLYYPLLSAKLLSFALGLPDRWKFSRRRKEDFLERALEDLLPGASWNTVQLPLAEWFLRSKTFRFWVTDRLDDLKRTAYFKNDFIDRLGTRTHGLDPAYYEKVLWLLVGFSCWIDQKSQQNAISKRPNILNGDSDKSISA